MNARLLKITGGEPTLHPDFYEIIQKVSEKNLEFSVFSNARWNSPTKIINFLNRIPQCHGLLISLHGADARTHDTFTGVSNSFEETCQNIRSAATAGLQVHTSTVITGANWNQVDKIAVLARNLGAKCAVFNRYLGLPSRSIEPFEWQFRAAMQSIEDLQIQTYKEPLKAFHVKYGNCIPQCFAPSSSAGCWAGIAYCTIDPWGNVRPCNHSPTQIGNILHSDITELWHSDSMNAWRALLPEMCSDCSKLPLCHGGCRAMIEISGTSCDPLATDPISSESSPRTEIELYQNASPKLCCTVKDESFGFALVRGTNILPIKQEAKTVLDHLDGRMTLGQIEDLFDKETLDFIGVLYVQGMVELRNN